MARVCHCGKDGHPLHSTECPVHGRKHAANSRALALGKQMRNGFKVRRVVWGWLWARHEKRPGEEIRRATIMIAQR